MSAGKGSVENHIKDGHETVEPRRNSNLHN